jgi:hypothetical protein
VHTKPPSPRFRDRLTAVVVPALGAITLACAMYTFSPHGAEATVSTTAGSADDAIPYKVIYSTPHFVIRGDITAADARAVGEWLDQVAIVFDEEARELGFSPTRSDTPMRIVFIRDRAEFVAFASRYDGVEASRMGGYYATASNRAVLYDDRTTDSFAAALNSTDKLERAEAARDVARVTRRKIAHEAAHLLAYNSGVQIPGVEYPAWFTEGLAERIATRAMGEQVPSVQQGEALGRYLAMALVGTDQERYASAHAAFEAMASRSPGAAARFAESLAAPERAGTAIASGSTED